MSPSFPLFIYFLIVINVHSLPSSAQDSLTTKSPTEVVDSNLTTNTATSLDSLLLSPTVVEGITLSAVIPNRTEPLPIPTVTSSTNETYSSAISPTNQEASDSPSTTGEALTNGTGRVSSNIPTKTGDLITTTTERTTPSSPESNGEPPLITAAERETSSISTTKKGPLLINATEEEALLGHTTHGTNEEALFINGIPALTEKISPIIESTGREDRISNDFSFNNETKTFTDKTSAIASAPLSTTISPSSTSQLEEGPFQVTPHLTKPQRQEKKMLASIPTKEVTKATVTPSVKAKKCCGASEFWDGANCVAKTNLSPFDPSTVAKQDSESGLYNFTWETMMPNCPKDYKYKVIRFSRKDVSLRANKTQSYLKWTELSMTRQTSQYCIDQQHDGNYYAVTCMADEEKVCNGGTCIRKCCPQGEVKSHTICKPENWNLNLSFYTLAGDASEAPQDLQLVPLVPNCPHKTTLKFSRFYRLLLNGKLYIKETGQTIDNNKFCTDYYMEEAENFVMYCFEKPSSVQELKVSLAPIGMIISILCLVFLILLHFFTKKLLNVQGYCFLSYSASLLLAYVGFFVNFKFAKQMHYQHCVFNGLFSQFTLHAAFFWLSVMCFDIWRVIRSTVKCIPLTGILEKDMQKFFLYAAYAFGCPLAIALVTLIMQSLPPESSAGMIVPGFGKESCWFADELAQFLYFYLAIATLNTLSLCMLGHVIYLLCQAEPGMACCLRKSKAPRAFNRKHLSLFRQRLSIFAMMAICWFTEVLSLKIPPKDAWVVTDILNTLQGVIVFIIFILSKQKRQLVKESMQRIYRKTLRNGRFPETSEGNATGWNRWERE
ncbi:probable G-protein coupled receptor Mth-like 1 [Macrobrachium rosenbergii]|uniref:probable G-protein coupled receptor Mth-like 1 n=1 Tax=Macrobrachium rosenbergii TaxID=79674 RepID=UPI0034D48F20